MPSKTAFPTRPIACWPKMKELRREHHRRNQRVQESDGVLIVGIAEEYLSLLAGIGEYATWQYEPRFTACMRDPAAAMENFEALEAHGYGRDLCASLRLHLGGVLLGHLDTALKGKKPHFVFQFELCPFSFKVARFVGERLGVPWVTLDAVERYREGATDATYVVEQMQEVIGEIERATGRRYDDERFVEAVRNEWECGVTWAKICMLTKAVPAPIDYRHLHSLRIPMVIDRDRSEVAAFYRELYDEVQDRVADGISARGFEEARLLYEGHVPFHTPNVMRLPELYGAIFVAGHGPFASYGAWSVYEDGTWVPATPPWERNPKIEMRNRQDALRALADLYLGDGTERRGTPGSIYYRKRPEGVLRRFHDWKAQGVVLANERRCRVSYLGHAELNTVLQKNGIPLVEFEPSTADVREFDSTQVFNRITAFFEGIGLQRVQPADVHREEKDDQDA